MILSGLELSIVNLLSGIDMGSNEHPEQPPTIQAPLDSLVRRPIGRIACVVA